MIAAGRRRTQRLLVVDTEGRDPTPTTIDTLPDHLAPGDLLVLNDAFTWPASLEGRTASAERVELRLAADLDGGVTFRAIALGAGDHTVPTEARGAPPALAVGDVVELARGGGAITIVDVDPTEPSLVAVRLGADRPEAAARILRAGRPVQYAHAPAPRALWDVQTPYAARPMAFEMPSAGRALVPSILARCRARGVAVATLTHAAGLSSTGRASLDARLPLPERTVVPEVTAHAVLEARQRRGRIVAVGTSVVRALEAAARRAAPGELVASGEAIATLRIDPSTPLLVVDGLLTGVHEPGTSHFDLLGALAGARGVERAAAAAARAGLVGHELGDAMLIAPPPGQAVTGPGISGTVGRCRRPLETTTSAPPR